MFDLRARNQFSYRLNGLKLCVLYRYGSYIYARRGVVHLDLIP